MKKCSFFAEQIKEWSRLYGRQITEEEYNEICANLDGFFDVLASWDREKLNKK